MRLTVDVDKIRPNPFRDFEKEPIQQEKVDRLVKSIEATEFWDNIMVRPAAGCCIEFRAYNSPYKDGLTEEVWFHFQKPRWECHDEGCINAKCVGFDIGEMSECEDCSECEFKREPRDTKTCIDAGCDFFEDYSDESLGLFELAYGHHRLEALKSLGIGQIEVECRCLDDEEMIKIMAAENSN